MSSKGEDGKESGAKTVATNAKSQIVADQLDLDKNPIKYATHDGSTELVSHDKPYMEMVYRAGKHSELVQKIMRQRIEKRAKEFPRWPGEATAGVRLMWIESRFWYDRERLSPDFDDDWRSYRARYLHSLELDPREPVHVPEYEKALLNPIRRFLMKGGDFLEDKFLIKVCKDKMHASARRWQITRCFMIWVFGTSLYYGIRYHNRKWEAKAGPELKSTAPVYYPSHPNFPFKEYHTEPAHFADMGFSRRNIFKDLRDFEDRTVVL